VLNTKYIFCTPQLAMSELKVGYLTKEGKTVQSWKRRWFILRPNEISYYK